MTTADLPARLIEAIEADEAAARTVVDDESIPGYLETESPWHCDEQSDHVAMAPAHVLAMCAAHREIVEIESRWMRRKDDAPSHQRGIDSDPFGDGDNEWVDLHNGRRLHGAEAKAFIVEWYEPAPPSRILAALATAYDVPVDAGRVAE